MTCKWYSARRKVQCQLDEHETGNHTHSENGRTTSWNHEAAFIPKDIGVSVVLPDSFRAVKRSN